MQELMNQSTVQIQVQIQFKFNKLLITPITSIASIKSITSLNNKTKANLRTRKNGYTGTKTKRFKNELFTNENFPTVAAITSEQIP